MKEVPTTGTEVSPSAPTDSGAKGEFQLLPFNLYVLIAAALSFLESTNPRISVKLSLMLFLGRMLPLRAFWMFCWGKGAGS